MQSGLHVEQVTSTTRDEFIAYALAHGAEHDDSFANVEDLLRFDPIVEPAALARSTDRAVVGAASLMVRGYASEGVARFRILHAADAADSETYSALADTVSSAAPASVRESYLFVPDGSPVAKTLEALGFTPSRYAIVLVRHAAKAGRPSGPDVLDGVEIAVVRPGHDERAWVGVANAAFADFPGRYDMTEEQATERLADERILKGGALIARRGSEPVGLIAVASYVDDGREVASIDHLAVVPSVQGRGIGRALLRRAIAIADAAGFDTIELSTGETNERALALYASEGFDVVQRVVCMARPVRR